ncbi:hypothetical protein GCM10022395_19410 [Snuella lapsa]|uniref:Sulfatase N-terminal domain-containing protein n=2 Tax=Snuella lapsa TaxID=870481 RepID=A0ABP6XQ70_9FLAO
MPSLYFAVNQDNDTWTKLSNELISVKLDKTPNIFVIQPDGYVNISEINLPPYNFDNSTFYGWLSENGFINYPNFRSNYYSTLTSNASMFAMKHHYYSNTNRSNLKTFNALEAIVGKDNNTLKILKNNNYKTHLITDNTYFLINRTPLVYDYCNVPLNKVSYYDTGNVKGVDIISDFESIIDTLSKNKNFFFIEKTLPSHVMYSKRLSKGISQERIEYLDRLELANEWIKRLFEKIKKFDEEAFVVIVADHGGYVGLEYTLEAVNRKLNPTEIKSAFSSMLSIKWPQKINSKGLKFKSNVNLFRNVFYSLTENKNLEKKTLEDTSFIPYFENGNYSFYKCIDKDYNIIFKPATPKD